MGKCLCEDGYIMRDEDGQRSYLTLVHGVEDSNDTPHWFLRVFVFNNETGAVAENFDVAYCPKCGKEL